MMLRRCAAVLAAVTVLGTTAAPAALADTAAPAPKIPDGLYGSTDPSYDGVWRQSYTLLALDASEVAPAGTAVTWLAGQQCADGGFSSYRADTAKACDAKTEDTNATSIAVQALRATGGQDAVVTKATDWLKTVQNTDGGWSYNPGGPTDANSTGVVIGALAATGADPGKVMKDGRSPYDALRSLQLGCDAEAADRGSFAFQPQDGKLLANAKATTGAVLGAHGRGFLFDAPGTDTPATAPDCSGDDPYQDLGTPASADAGAAYLVAQLQAGKGRLTAVTPGADEPQPDYGTTADAVIALAGGGQTDAAKESYDWLAKNAGAWAKGSPGALAQLVLAAHSTGNDPRSAGGADLVRQLADLGPETPKTPEAQPEKDQGQKDDAGSSSAIWWIVGTGVIVGVAVGLVITLRRKNQA